MKKTINKIYYLVAFGLLLSPAAFAQDNQELQALIKELENNNTALHSIKTDINARKIENRTGLNPADPTVGVSYLRPNPRLTDHNLNYEITQELEFPTVYGNRRRVANKQNEVLDLEYELRRTGLLVEALEYWANWLYFKQNQEILALQHAHASQISQAYQKAFESGQVSILDRNRARINELNSKQALELNQIQMQTELDNLTRINAGKPVQQLPQAFPAWSLPVLFEDWQQSAGRQSVEIASLNKELNTNQAQERLAKSMQLPNLQLGYMREQDIEVDFRGVTFGISLPLWQYKNVSKQAKLRTQAQEALILDVSQQTELEQRNLFKKAKALGGQAQELDQLLADTKAPDLLRKALDLNEITLVEYLVEQSMYYELMEKAINTKKEYALTQIQLRKWLF